MSKPKPWIWNGKTIAIDLDGTIADYTQGWQDGKIGKPLPWAKEALETFRAGGFRIIIFSVRCTQRYIDNCPQNGQFEEVVEYLTKHQIPFDEIHIGVGKPNACLFIDDKGYRFNPEKGWLGSLEEIVPILEKELKGYAEEERREHE